MSTENKDSNDDAQIITHNQVISDAPGSLERLLMNLRRRRVHIMHMEVTHEEGCYHVEIKAKTDRPHRIAASLDRLWDVRKCQTLNKRNTQS